MKFPNNVWRHGRMSNEERLTQQLTGQFPFLSEATRIQRERRIFVKCEYVRFMEVFEYIVQNMRFDRLSTLTGFDDGEVLSVMYHMANSEGQLLNLSTSVPKADPKLKTVTSFFPTAELYERELIDLLGFDVEGLPEGGNRYPLTDDWPRDEHPLRKDWGIKEEAKA